jgi:hypothetical protein
MVRKERKEEQYARPNGSKAREWVNERKESEWR